MEPHALLQHLGKARWHVAARTFGNAHATLVGLLVDWWISLAPDRNWVIEAGPGNGYSEKGERGQCDALFCQDEQALGVMEVEGAKYVYTARKLGSFFAARYSELSSLRFGILLLYAQGPVGRLPHRRFPPAASPEGLDEVMSVTAKYPGKAVAAIVLEKRYVTQRAGIRARDQNQYSWGEPNRIEGILFLNGMRADSAVFYHEGAS